jgi:hypothetical protein
MVACLCELFKLLTAVQVFISAIISVYLNSVWPMESSKVSSVWHHAVTDDHYFFFFTVIVPTLFSILFCDSVVSVCVCYVLEAQFTLVDHAVVVGRSSTIITVPYKFL